MILHFCVYLLLMFINNVFKCSHNTLNINAYRIFFFQENDTYLEQKKYGHCHLKIKSSS